MILVLLCGEALCGETIYYLWLVNISFEEFRTDLVIVQDIILIATVKYFSQIEKQQIFYLQTKFAIFGHLILSLYGHRSPPLHYITPA